MSEPGPGTAIGIPALEHGDLGQAPRVSAFGHPRKGLRAIPRYPLSTADVEADRIMFATTGRPLNVGGSYPVRQGGIVPIGT
jgi:hypothetical protein